MDDEERDLTRRSFRGLLAAHPPDELPQQLIDAGWTELLEQDPAAAVSLLADEQGRTLVAGPALNFALMHGLGIPADGTTAVVLPDLTGPSRLPGSDAGGRLEISGIVLGGAGASRFVVATDKAIFEVAAGSIQLRPAQGLDPSLGLQRVAGTVPVDGRELAPVSAWHDATAVGRRALGAELVGIGQAMLEASVDYVGSRRQFGHPIGTFQAVKHRLADVHVGLSAARAALDAAWQADDDVSALAARCLAGRAFLEAATHCHQVHGAIAFTVDHGLHRYLRRGYVLESLLGSTAELTWELGRHLLASGGVPHQPNL